MLSFILLAVALGFKHSLDADHLLAVSHYFKRAKTSRNVIRLSFAWAAGHLLTATMLAVVLFAFQDTLLKEILGRFNGLVGIMLIVLGGVSIYRSSGFHFHKHGHAHGPIFHSHPHIHSPLEEQKKKGEHVHLFGIGILQGLASNDELLFLFTATLGFATLSEWVGGVFFFSMGVVAGMIGFGLLFLHPAIRGNANGFSNWLDRIVGGLSIGYGVILLMGL